MSPIPEVAMPQNSVNEEESSSSSDEDPPSNNESNFIPVTVFQDAAGDYYLWLDLWRAIYYLEFLIFPLVTNSPVDLITLQQWIAKGAEKAGWNINEIQHSGLNAKIIENLIASTID
ncbi:9718_t:CDS:2 [Dentiscutata erythropus]|uniref:9718_t:CDS:1 n=1 Tax=Dentiscutata erythropus TaxID=1348616 RepID=A0A9N9HCQ5_9GLOM|nr:9718_t:CDS:2 [Dentiscutata erythropus]